MAKRPSDKHKRTAADLPQGAVDLFDQEHILYTLIDNMPDYIYIKDRESRFILANQKILDVHGLSSRKDILGKKDHDFYPGDLADKFRQDEQGIIRSGQSLINVEEKALDQGKTIWLSTTKIPLRDAAGKIIGIVGMGRDITARKEAEASFREQAEQLQEANTRLEERQEVIQQQAEELASQARHLSRINKDLKKMSVAVRETDNVVFILDAAGNFEFVNKSFERVYGYTMEQYVAERGRNILQGSHNPYIRQIMEKCRNSKETIRYQSEARDRDGNTIWAQSVLTPVLDKTQEIIQFIGIDTDITALKKAQELINQQKLEIEKQRDALEKANATKDKFFSIIAHDLKNPFHSILGFSDLMVKNYISIPDEKRQEYLGLIRESAGAANALLDNLLQWSRTQTNRIRYEPASVALARLAEDTHQMLHTGMEKKQLRYEMNMPDDLVAWCDPNMTQTVLRNLISNAVKFTPAGGRISLHAAKSGKQVDISISDTGVGIPEKQQQVLFSLSGVQSSTGTEGEPGTGLGLIICREFVRIHGGELNFHSTPGKGTTFTFSLPAEKPGE